ncbi:MAG TPA: response regulator [Thermotogota bacterium]|nr:response regulator [Thermotogota bacterium]HPJ89443.1 response regulator [Thermotogota bacterium]HPR95268.1 response regulator [Thermotogota bacterium]
MKCLIVEDDPITTKLLMAVFEEYGECDHIDNGIDGLDMVIKANAGGDPYDLVTLDIMMPKMDGHDVLARVKRLRNNKAPKVIMITALGDKKNIQKSYVRGCDGYLIKPIEREVILKKLRTLELID